MEDLILSLPKVASLYALAFFSFWPAMPAGLALGLHPVVVVATATLSYISGATVMLLLGERLCAWFRRRFQRRQQEAGTASPGLISRAWRRFGVIGLGLLAPMTVGAQTGALLGLSLDVRPRRLLFWMSLGALGWSVLIMLGALLGVAGLSAA